MKVLKTVTKGNKTVVTVEINAGDKLIAINDDRYYQLGDPLNDVVSGHLIADVKEVTWCSIEQKWRG